MTIAQNFPKIRPSLNLDFANSKALDPRITFHRASSATYYGTKTAKAEENLMIRSQEFDNTFWSTAANNISVSANTETAPDGTTTAETLTDNATNGPHRLLTSGAAWSLLGSTAFTLSVFLKKGTLDCAYIGFRDGATTFRYIAAAFDLDAGTAGDTFNPGDGTLVGSTITAVGNGWYRCTVTGALSGTAVLNPNVVIGMATTATGLSLGGFLAETYSGASDAIFVWGAQLEQRDAATAYTPTTDQPITNYIPVLESAAAGVARFDHNPVTGESLGLLIEESRTNLLLRSEEFDNSFWVKSNSSVTENTVIAPDGTLTGDKLFEDTDTAQHSTRQLVTVADNTTVTATVYVKAAERSVIRLSVIAKSGSFPGRYFDLANGTMGTSISSPAATSITPVGNGWYRCSVTADVATGVTSPGMQIWVTTANNVISNTGDGFSGFFIWGAQLEVGAFPTSYIPTTTAQVTRGADAASMTGANFSSWYNQTEGTLYAEAASQKTGASCVVSLDDGGSANTINISASNNTGTVFFGLNKENVGQLTGPSASDPIVLFKAVLAYKTNDAAWTLNAGTVRTDDTVILPIADRMQIGARGGISVPLVGHIRKIAYYPKRIANAELQALTS